MKIPTHLLLITLLAALTACSKGKTTQSKLELSMGGLTAGMTFNGGGLLSLHSTTTNEKFEYELTTTNKVELPHGTWDMYFVGFEGSSAWAGPHKCGTVSAVNLSLAEQTIQIQVNSAACSGATYTSMIALKNPSAVAGQWDTDNWDQKTWGP